MVRNLLLATAALFMLLAGCDETDSGGTTEVVPSKPITVEGIIVNPKSPAPGDTVRLTVVVSSNGSNEGDFPTYAWSANGGSFVDNNRTTVRWVAPTTSSVFQLSVTAKNLVSTSSGSETVFVGELSVLVSSQAGEFLPQPSGEFYYLSSPLNSTAAGFGRTQVRLNTGTADQEINLPDGYVYQFNSDFSQCVYMTLPNGTAGQGEVTLMDMPSGVRSRIAFDRRADRPGNRFRSYKDPDITPNSAFACYWGVLVDAIPPTQGGLDTIGVFVQNLATDEEERVTFVADNYYPSFSPDGNFMVFISNRVRENSRWDLFQLPVTPSGVEADTAGSLVQLTTNTADFIREVNPPQRLRAKWSPPGSAPSYAVNDANNNLYLIPMDRSGPTQVNLPGNVTDFVWSPSGQDIAAVSGTTIYRVDRSGVFSELVVAIAGDILSNVSWSPDESALVYNVRRVQDSWYELYDLSGSLGLPGPIPLTGTRNPGDQALYSPIMDTRPAWFPGQATVNVLFFDRTTPRAERLDLSGMLQP